MSDSFIFSTPGGACGGGASALGPDLAEAHARIVAELRTAHPTLSEAAVEAIAQVRVEAMQQAVSTTDWRKPEGPEDDAEVALVGVGLRAEAAVRARAPVREPESADALAAEAGPEFGGDPYGFW
jgi:hypothetical protein